MPAARAQPGHGSSGAIAQALLSKLGEAIAKVYQVDPLLCTRCGRCMSIVAFVTDCFAIRRILDHLGLSPQPQDKPPPMREVLRVAEHGEGWGVPAAWE